MELETLKCWISFRIIQSEILHTLKIPSKGRYVYTLIYILRIIYSEKVRVRKG